MINAPKQLAYAAALLLGFGIAVTSQAGELIVNGGFETGDFTGWATGVQAGSDPQAGFIATNALSAPAGGGATVGPAAGNFYALSDQAGPNTQYLTQTVVIPGTFTSVILSFDMFVNDQSGLGPIVDPTGLDFTTGGTSNPNRHGRVDLLPGGSPVLSTAPADVLGNFYLGNDPTGSNPNPYTSYQFDITALVSGGGVFDLRFAEVDNQLFFNMGVDNVSLIVSGVPEPSPLAILALGLFGMGLSRYRGKA